MSTYDIPSVGSGTEPLTAPTNVGHANLHDRVRDAIGNIAVRLNSLETAASNAVMNIQQARLAALTLSVPGELAVTGEIIRPMIWNITGRSVTLVASRITVITPPVGGSVDVDILISPQGPSGAGPMGFDPAGMTVAGSLTIPDGMNVSATLNSFAATTQPLNTFVAAIVRSVGATAPGSDLTIQINRNL